MLLVSKWILVEHSLHVFKEQLTLSLDERLLFLCLYVLEVLDGVFLDRRGCLVRLNDEMLLVELFAT